MQHSRNKSSLETCLSQLPEKSLGAHLQAALCVGRLLTAVQLHLVPGGGGDPQACNEVPAPSMFCN